MKCMTREQFDRWKNPYKYIEYTIQYTSYNDYEYRKEAELRRELNKIALKKKREAEKVKTKNFINHPGYSNRTNIFRPNNRGRR